MAFLEKAGKQDLILLAENLGLRVSDKMTIKDLKTIITGNKDYEEEFLKPYFSVISEECVERKTEENIARQHAIEQENIARQHAIEQENIARQHAIEQENIARQHAIEQENIARQHAIEQENIARQHAISKKILPGSTQSSRKYRRQHAIEQENIARQHAIEQQQEQREFELEKLRLDSKRKPICINCG
ncbi:hypothetical protein TNCV_2673631 [Trichonephila clavipes]|nr:hypothetical protein TNCV_2673631 [Trichonephila clavipes]